MCIATQMSHLVKPKLRGKIIACPMIHSGGPVENAPTFRAGDTDSNPNPSANVSLKLAINTFFFSVLIQISQYQFYQKFIFFSLNDK